MVVLAAACWLHAPADGETGLQPPWWWRPWPRASRRPSRRGRRGRGQAGLITVGGVAPWCWRGHAQGTTGTGAEYNLCPAVTVTSRVPASCVPSYDSPDPGGMFQQHFNQYFYWLMVYIELGHTSSIHIDLDRKFDRFASHPNITEIIEDLKKTCHTNTLYYLY